MYGLCSRVSWSITDCNGAIAEETLKFIETWHQVNKLNKATRDKLICSLAKIKFMLSLVSWVEKSLLAHVENWHSFYQKCYISICSKRDDMRFGQDQIYVVTWFEKIVIVRLAHQC